MNNSEQKAFWSGAMGDGWVAVSEVIDRLMEPLTIYGLDAAAAQAGERFIDIGCGCGGTTRRLAANGAAVWGVDISEPMIAGAKAATSDGESVYFSVADAASADYTADHQGVFSRYGVMFFDDPVSAFSNIRSALVPGGRLVFLCWQVPEKNPWLTTSFAVVADLDPDPAPAPDPLGPGPFSLADPERTRSILTDAGFSDIEMVSVSEDLNPDVTLDDVMAFQTRVGPLSGLLEKLDEQQGQAAIEAVREAYAQRFVDGVLSLPAANWLVKARNPG